MIDWHVWTSVGLALYFGLVIALIVIAERRHARRTSPQPVDNPIPLRGVHTRHAGPGTWEPDAELVDGRIDIIETAPGVDPARARHVFAALLRDETSGGSSGFPPKGKPDYPVEHSEPWPR